MSIEAATARIQQIIARQSQLSAPVAAAASSAASARRALPTRAAGQTFAANLATAQAAPATTGSTLATRSWPG